jgi:hypothetical protein
MLQRRVAERNGTWWQGPGALSQTVAFAAIDIGSKTCLFSLESAVLVSVPVSGQEWHFESFCSLSAMNYVVVVVVTYSVYI